MDAKTEWPQITKFKSKDSEQEQFQVSKQNRLSTVHFLLQGIISLTSWNSILSSLDYFSSVYPSYNASFYLPIPYVVAINLASFVMPWISTRVTYNLRIYFSIGIMAILQVLFIIIAQNFQNDSETGFVILIIMILLSGIFGQIFSSSQIGTASQLGYQQLVMFNTGNSISGVISILLRIICLEVYGDPSLNDENKPSTTLKDSTLLYFICGSIICLAGIISHYLFFKSSEFQDQIRKHMSFISLEFEKQNLYEIDQPLIKNSQQIHSQAEQQPQYQQNQQISNNNNNNKENNNNNQKIATTDINSDLDANNRNRDSNNNNGSGGGIGDSGSGNNSEKVSMQVLQVFKLILPLPLFIILINLTSMMMFPGVALMTKIQGLNETWSTITIIASYNVTNAVGKFFARFRKLYTKKLIYLLIICRISLFTVFIINAEQKATFLLDTEFIIINIVIFSFIDGLSNGALFVLAAEEVYEQQEKELAGFLMAVALSIGIMCGSFLALPFQNI